MIIHQVEQRTEEWFKLRGTIPTASQFSRLITSTGEMSKQIQAYADELAGAMYAGKPLDKWQGNSSTDRGAALEPEAIAAYEFLSGNKVEKVGFITDDAKQYGASPDGLIGEDGCLEIKCPEAKGHIEVLKYYRKHGKCPTDYVQQTQGEILVSERKWCDLFFYHPDLPSITIRQDKDLKLQEALLIAIEQCNKLKMETLTMLKSF